MHRHRPDSNRNSHGPEDEDRLIVELELDPNSGQVVAMSGEASAIKRACSILFKAGETHDSSIIRYERDGSRLVPETGRFGTDEDPARAQNPGHAGTDLESLLSESEIRHRANPANILAAIRRERELPSAALRLVGSECERELRSNSTDAPPTPSQERELQARVGPRDQRNLEREPSGHSLNLDARSGSNGNAAGSSTAVGHQGSPDQTNLETMDSARIRLQPSIIDTNDDRQIT
ncbi:MAG: hypothetical protein GY895_15450 [Phycisphaera sp.]|nr:hypothetical protein [Phycisphaera sp.]